MTAWHHERSLVLETARKLVDKGLVIGKAGNVSLRLPAEGGRSMMAITPTSRYCESISADDIPVVDFDGQLVFGSLAPSSELMLHAETYRARPAVNAVIHTHSTYASAVAVIARELPAILEEEIFFLGGEISVAEYAQSGTRELAMNAVRAMGEKNGALLANHGAVGVGRSMREALNVCEILEKAAKIYLLTLAVGKLNPLRPEAVAAAKAVFLRLQHREDT